jgi:hypothetical protein
MNRNLTKAMTAVTHCTNNAKEPYTTVDIEKL